MAPHVIDIHAQPLKQRALLFDKLRVVGLEKAMRDLDRLLPGYSKFEIASNWPERRAELDYLIERGFLIDETDEPVRNAR